MEKEISKKDIAIHAKSKNEVYLMLTVKEGIYLSPIMDANKKYIQNIRKGHRKFLSKDIKVVKVPQIEKLSNKKLWNELMKTLKLILTFLYTNIINI